MKYFSTGILLILFLIEGKRLTNLAAQINGGLNLYACIQTVHTHYILKFSSLVLTIIIEYGNDNCVLPRYKGS